MKKSNIEKLVELGYREDEVQGVILSDILTGEWLDEIDGYFKYRSEATGLNLDISSEVAAIKGKIATWSGQAAETLYDDVNKYLESVAEPVDPNLPSDMQLGHLIDISRRQMNQDQYGREIGKHLGDVAPRGYLDLFEA